MFPENPLYTADLPTFSTIDALKFVLNVLKIENTSKNSIDASRIKNNFDKDLLFPKSIYELKKTVVKITILDDSIINSGIFCALIPDKNTKKLKPITSIGKTPKFIAFNLL
jgi:hypothetical protein